VASPRGSIVPSEFRTQHLPPTSHALVGEDPLGYVRELEPHAERCSTWFLSSHQLRRQAREGVWNVQDDQSSYSTAWSPV